MEDLEAVMRILKEGKEKMRESGNLSQWSGGYPSSAIIEEDIRRGQSFVVEEDGRIVAAFAFIMGEDPTYKRIEDGKWLNDEPYGTIHRIASAKGARGIMRKVLEWAFAKTENVRIDTHADNALMLHILVREGFAYCGIIYVSDGTPRKAYQKCNGQRRVF
ncbi:MAG: N-acetyltransferase [Bacteroidales bacterium]|nr:N-acetyltransferase [Bacteroidales bacterium]